VKLYWMAKNTDASNREFNIESERISVHDNYLTCLRILTAYARTHKESVLAYSVWGGRKRLGLKFQDRNVTIGDVKSGEVPLGVTREVKNPFELRRFLENTMGFTVSNLNEQSFEKAYEQLKKIESEKEITISVEAVKEWHGP
jgi:hypothetical protein